MNIILMCFALITPAQWLSNCDTTASSPSGIVAPVVTNVPVTAVCPCCGTKVQRGIQLRKTQARRLGSRDRMRRGMGYGMGVRQYQWRGRSSHAHKSTDRGHMGKQEWQSRGRHAGNRSKGRSAGSRGGGNGRGDGRGKGRSEGRGKGRSHPTPAKLIPPAVLPNVTKDASKTA